MVQARADLVTADNLGVIPPAVVAGFAEPRDRGRAVGGAALAAGYRPGTDLSLAGRCRVNRYPGRPLCSPQSDRPGSLLYLTDRAPGYLLAGSFLSFTVSL